VTIFDFPKMRVTTL